MKIINKIAKKHNLFLIEDCCEALGAKYEMKKVGTFGDLSTFSFFASHHITTMEGGMLITNNQQLFEIAKSLRTHGWTRNLKNKKALEKKYSKIDSRFLFSNLGYNLRPTELQGAFGIHQIKMEKEKSGSLKNSTDLMKNAFLIGNNQNIDKFMRKYVSEIIIKFLDSKIER
jgi:CDP-6-deoxy-D-xylo-4-hexulose-3-dehydrase